MPDHRRRSPARLLAPLALLLVAAAVFVVVAGATSSDDEPKKPAASTEQRSEPETTTTAAPKAKPQKASYTVKAGDTLGGIAEQTGVSVERLQELNPELDPQALVSGQKIKLRE
jgi:LysM repeat protein